MNQKGPVFIYGVPGSGKTHLSQLLQAKLGIPLLEADILRAEAQKNTTKEKDPFLFVGTCQAYKNFGELNSENCIRGLKAVRDALKDEVLSKLINYRGIVEGAFLDPHILRGQGQMQLIVTRDEARHKNYFFQHRPESQENLDEFRAARLVQDYLIQEATELGIGIIENNDTSKQ